MRKLKRVLSLLLCITIIVISVAVSPGNVYASTTPGTVTQAQVEAKLANVVNMLKGKYFNKDNMSAPCLHAPGESGHGCDKCNSINILGSGSSWFRSLLGINTTSYYGTYNTYTGSMVRGYSCVGFANLVGWYLFQTSESDVIKYNALKKGDFNKQSFVDARPGDIVALCDSNGNHIHSMIFLSLSDTGIEVLDCNWSRQTYGNCYIQVHNFNFSSYPGYKVAINRASNYAVNDTSDNLTFTHSASSCQAQHQDVVYGTSSAADAVGRMSNIAQNYNGWYRDCFNNVGASGLGYYDYIMWYVRKLAENAGAAKIFSNSNDMAAFYKEMIEKYGAKGYYIPANCVQGYDVSPFANAAQITWAQKDIKAGDIIFVWDKGVDGSNMNFEHCYFVQRVENDVAYVTDGGVFNSAGAVKARYDKTYSSLSSTGTWISTHLVGYIRPDYAGLDRGECKHETTVIKDSRKETCGAAGYTGDTYCGSCGVLLKKGTDIKPTGNHKWNEGVVTKEATENEKGTRLFTCTVCNATKTENYEAAVKANGMRVIGDRKYWYENGERQGVKYNSDGSIDASYRGKEVYDPESDEWYWLDNVQQGAVAVNKDVYQESEAGAWGETQGAAGKTYGKWVRYDSDGHMVKGWQTTEKGTYYFDLVYGTMAKGSVTIDGKNYVFDRNTGILIYDIDDNGASFEENGWHFVNGEKYWYENGKRQGVKYNNDGSNDLSYRGKEIYDPSSDAWYWLDNVLDGAVAKSKDVYQESAAGKWGDKLDANGNRIGKWVRYDENGHMVKGWQTTEAGTYYFDPVYGTMAKGEAVIDGQTYYFDVNTGVLQ